MQAVPGFLGALLLADWATGHSLGLTFWQSEEAMRASEEAAGKFRREGADKIGASKPATVERFEVAYYGVPEASAQRRGK
jgi:heme-degrading monooxygenase HmoA